MYLTKKARIALKAQKRGPITRRTHNDDGEERIHHHCKFCEEQGPAFEQWWEREMARRARPAVRLSSSRKAVFEVGRDTHRKLMAYEAMKARTASYRAAFNRYMNRAQE